MWRPPLPPAPPPKQQLKEAEGTGGPGGCQLDVQGLPNGRGGAPNDSPGAAAPALPTLAFKCSNMTMAALAEYMHTMPLAQQFIGANPLVDETGLKGAWNFEFHYALPMGGPAPYRVRSRRHQAQRPECHRTRKRRRLPARRPYRHQRDHSRRI